MFRQFAGMVIVAAVAVVVFVKADVVGRVTYSMEMARLRAQRDARTVERHPAPEADSARTLAQSVLPAVVSITTERTVVATEADGIDPHIRKFLMPDQPGATKEPAEVDGQPPGSDGPNDGDNAG